MPASCSLASRRSGLPSASCQSSGLFVLAPHQSLTALQLCLRYIQVLSPRELLTPLHSGEQGAQGFRAEAASAGRRAGERDERGEGGRGAEADVRSPGLALHQRAYGGARLLIRSCISLHRASHFNSCERHALFHPRSSRQPICPSRIPPRRTPQTMTRTQARSSRPRGAAQAVGGPCWLPGRATRRRKPPRLSGCACGRISWRMGACPVALSLEVAPIFSSSDASNDSRRRLHRVLSGSFFIVSALGFLMGSAS